MTTHYDAIVLGAGMGGLYALKKLRDEQGLNVRLFDKASGVGGTWYWNQYPGAMSDTETHLYGYAHDKELREEWPLEERYVYQPTLLKYFQHVADRWNLYPNIQFNTTIRSMVYDENRDMWMIATDAGEEFTAKFVVTAIGLLAATQMPDIAGIETFKGELYHTGAFPKDVTVEGKRVGIIGTGSTGVQVITEIGSKVGHLTVFQRNAQFVVPAHQRLLTEEEQREIKRNFDKIWNEVYESGLGFGFEETTRVYADFTPEEREAIFEEAWQHGGGFYMMFATFSDIVVSEEANIGAQEFIKRKIRELVKDPETARKLMPNELYARRPLCDRGYYQVFNRDNVELVHVKENPIVRITENAVVTADGVEHELDMLILATGFDAVDGNYKRMQIDGRDGISIADHWKGQPASVYGVMTAKFPNMFMVLGPNGPFTNLPPSIETQVEWISDAIKYANANGIKSIEPELAVEQAWTASCREMMYGTLFPKAESWIFGGNVPGKESTVYFYVGGLKTYRELLNTCAASQYEGFELVS